MDKEQRNICKKIANWRRKNDIEANIRDAGSLIEEAMNDIKGLYTEIERKNTAISMARQWILFYQQELEGLDILEGRKKNGNNR